MSKQTLENYFEDYLENLCEDSEQVKAADRNSYECFAKICDEDAAWEADWCHHQAVYQHEMQGFFGGFMYAMQLFPGKAGVVE